MFSSFLASRPKGQFFPSVVGPNGQPAHIDTASLTILLFEIFFGFAAGFPSSGDLPAIHTSCTSWNGTMSLTITSLLYVTLALYFRSLRTGTYMTRRKLVSLPRYAKVLELSGYSPKNTWSPPKKNALRNDGRQVFDPGHMIPPGQFERQLLGGFHVHHILVDVGTQPELMLSGERRTCCSSDGHWSDPASTSR